MGYTDEWGEWQEDDPPQEVKPALWVPKKVQSVAPVAKHQVAKHQEVAKHVAKHSGNPAWSKKEAQRVGQLGGLARRDKVPPERRKEIAQRAAQAMWAKRR